MFIEKNIIQRALLLTITIFGCQLSSAASGSNALTALGSEPSSWRSFGSFSSLSSFKPSFPSISTNLASLRDSIASSRFVTKFNELPIEARIGIGAVTVAGAGLGIYGLYEYVKSRPVEINSAPQQLGATSSPSAASSSSSSSGLFSCTTKEQGYEPWEQSAATLTPEARLAILFPGDKILNESVCFDNKPFSICEDLFDGWLNKYDGQPTVALEYIVGSPNHSLTSKFLKFLVSQGANPFGCYKDNAFMKICNRFTTPPAEQFFNGMVDALYPAGIHSPEEKETAKKEILKEQKQFFDKLGDTCEAKQTFFALYKKYVPEGHALIDQPAASSSSASSSSSCDADVRKRFPEPRLSEYSLVRMHSNAVKLTDYTFLGQTYEIYCGCRFTTALDGSAVYQAGVFRKDDTDPYQATILLEAPDLTALAVLVGSDLAKFYGSGLCTDGITPISVEEIELRLRNKISPSSAASSSSSHSTLPVKLHEKNKDITTENTQIACGMLDDATIKVEKSYQDVTCTFGQSTYPDGGIAYVAVIASGDQKVGFDSSDIKQLSKFVCSTLKDIFNVVDIDKNELNKDMVSSFEAAEIKALEEKYAKDRNFLLLKLRQQYVIQGKVAPEELQADWEMLVLKAIEDEDFQLAQVILERVKSAGLDVDAQVMRTLAKQLTLCEHIQNNKGKIQAIKATVDANSLFFNFFMRQNVGAAQTDITTSVLGGFSPLSYAQKIQKSE